MPGVLKHTTPHDMMHGAIWEGLGETISNVKYVEFVWAHPSPNTSVWQCGCPVHRSGVYTGPPEAVKDKHTQDCPCSVQEAVELTTRYNPFVL